MKIRKIDAMHAEHGIDLHHQCKTCCNFRSGRYHDRILRKCKAYGMTHSEASDWAGSWVACGLYDKNFDTMNIRPLMETLNRPRTEIDNTPLPGQIEMEVIN